MVCKLGLESDRNYLSVWRDYIRHTGSGKLEYALSKQRPSSGETSLNGLSRLVLVGPLLEWSE